MITSINNGELYLTEISSDGEHTIMVDEPESLGGTNKGMSPEDLLAASLASCTNITLRMYFNRKGWNASQIKVTVQLDKADLNQVVFKRTINIEGDLDELQQNRVIAIANACPVHKILMNTVKIETLIA